jgi:arsenate reductase
VKHRVLFVCIHNSARSQMAEELLRRLAGDRFEAESAGLEPGAINPLVAQLLLEEGIDLAGKKTQSVFDLLRAGRRYDTVVTVCGPEAEDRCPVFPGAARRLSWQFPDPSRLEGTEEEKLARLREIRDQIALEVEKLAFRERS